MLELVTPHALAFNPANKFKTSEHRRNVFFETGKGNIVIHYTCDRCAKMIDPDLDLRYVVRIEIQASMECDNACDEQDDDHLLDLEEILERLEDEESPNISEDVYQRRKFDLCSACYHEYKKNPLARENQLHFGFSQN